MMEKVDNLIVGGGASGLFAGLSVAQYSGDGRTMLIEASRKFGGAGARSDGKIKLDDDFFTLRKRGIVSDPSEIGALRLRLLRTLDNSGVPYAVYPDTRDRADSKVFYDTETKRIDQAQIKSFGVRREKEPTIHIGTNNLNGFISSILEVIRGRIDVRSGVSMSRLVQSDNGFVAITSIGEILAKRVALCLGRKDTDFAWRLIEPFDIDEFTEEALVGGRVEVSREALWQTKAVYAPCYRDSESTSGTFNFCTCEGGEITRGTHIVGDERLLLVNGHSNLGGNGDSSNFGLLTELRSDDFNDPNAAANQFARVANQHNPKRIVISDLQEIVTGRPNNIQEVFEQSSLLDAYKRIQRWLSKMSQLYPDIMRGGRMILPEIKVRSRRAKVFSDLVASSQGERIEGLYLGGDSFVTSNLFDAHMTGMVIGDHLALNSSAGSENPPHSPNPISN